jgi:uncharacterized protein
MKFHLNTAPGNAFSGYGEGYVEINGARFDFNLLVAADRIDPRWVPGGFDALVRDDFAKLLEWSPEIVLLGTGQTIRFPHPRLTQDLTRAHIGVDVMDVKAACRTFNVLAGEGRRVLAALLLV